MTTIYLIRHSLVFTDMENYNNNETFQMQNEKQPLSVEGENRARILSEYEELQDIDYIVSSNYTRALSTAKYIASKNNLKVEVNENFNERLFGIDAWTDINKDFFERQINEPNYKIKLGECQEEVRDRMHKGLLDVLHNYKDKKIVILSHNTAMTFLLMKWCEIKLTGVDRHRVLIYKDKVIFDRPFDAPEVFKIEFEDINPISIEHIVIKELEQTKN